MNFFRGWEAYRDGFGKLTGEHWLGETPDARPAGWPALSLCTTPCHIRAPSSRGCRPGLPGATCRGDQCVQCEGAPRARNQRRCARQGGGGGVSRRDVCFSCRGRPGTWSLSWVRQLWPVQGHRSRCWRARTTPVLPCAWGVSTARCCALDTEGASPKRAASRCSRRQRPRSRG